MAGHASYQKKILRECKERERKLLNSPLNWFSLVGLHPLRSGENSVGAGVSMTIRLPQLPVHAEVVLESSQNRVYLLRVSDEFLINDSPVTPRQLQLDTDGQPDLLTCGSITMMVIRRGTRHFLRVWDRDAQALKDFHGLKYFPVDPAWRITAEFFPFDPPRQVTINDAVGGETRVSIPGYARFDVNGCNCALMGEDDDGGLLFSFTDLTRQDATYPGGRYLLAAKPAEGRVILDFNLARNWPCAYTPYATCPLPPPENQLRVRVEAGEKRYYD